MLPKIWIFDLYNILIVIGVIAALYVLYLFAKRVKMDQKLTYTIAIIATISILAGLGFAIIFQSLFDLLEGNTSRPFAMTFYGGLVGGAVTFLVIYTTYVRKKHPEARFIQLLTIAPAAITIAHAFGRVGCFCAGCCYGIETNSWLGMQFPHLPNPVYPTQLFEAFFLFVLAGLLFYLAYRREFKYTMPVYLISYGVWRFLIEFIRGDDRGSYILSLSPSQWFSIIGIIGGIALIYVIKKYFGHEEIKNIEVVTTNEQGV